MIEEDLSLNYANNVNGQSDSSASLIPPRKRLKPSRGLRMKRSQTHSQEILTPTPLTHSNPTEIDSLISPVIIRRKIDGFVEPEITLMLEEIGKRRHILLSKSCRYNRLRKEAWEEVALSVASRYPQSPKRSGMQMKKKWDYLILTAKRKINESKLNRKMQIDGIAVLVIEFLASVSQEMRQSEQMPTLEVDDKAPLFMAQQQQQLDAYYDHTSATQVDSRVAAIQAVKPSLGATPANLDNFMNGIVPATGNFVSSSEGGKSVGVANAANSTNNEDDVGEDSSISDVLVIDNRSIDGPNGIWESEIATLGLNQNVRSGVDLKEDLLRKSRNEHALRMEVLQLQRRYWQFKIDAFLRRSCMFVGENQAQQN
ncbi:hypothetical protein Aperf_G00000021301 [Anoplocephala perfoliata]